MDHRHSLVSLNKIESIKNKWWEDVHLSIKITDNELYKHDIKIIHDRENMWLLKKDQ